MRPVRMYWCHRCGAGRNFGDQLGPVLLAHFGIRYEWAGPAQAELVTVGSVLSKIPATSRATILGTGLIEAPMRRSFRRARVLAVRGELTRRACGLRPSVPLGDPGVLAPDLAPRAHRRPDGPVTIVPHYVDAALAGRHPSARALDIRTGPAALIGRIAASSLVITSSLHALIAADALGVPHVLELSSRTIGGLHKFRDYTSAFGLELEPDTVRLTPRGLMAAKQAELRAIFAELAIERGGAGAG